MGRKAARRAHALLQSASGGAIRRGHLGIYDLINDKLRAAGEGLAGREDLLQYDKIRRALDAKVEEFTKTVQDPSVEDRACMVDGVHKLLSACMPLYDALNKDRSLKKACDALNDAERTLDRCADEDEECDEYRKLHGGWVIINGKRVKLNAKDFAKWQAANKQYNLNFKQNPYSLSNQTAEEHVDALKSNQKTRKRRQGRYARQTKKACVEEEEPTPPGLRMRVRPNKTKAYTVLPKLFNYAPAGASNHYRTMEAAMELAALCEANRPAGMGREAKQAARAQKGLPDGVTPYQGGFKAQVIPKKNTHVTLAAPGGGSVFGTAKAAAKAIKDYEDAGSPTKKSHPLVKYINHG